MSLYHGVPERIENSPVFQKVWGRMHRLDKNYMAAVCGETGSGKSYAALSFAEVIDPDFSIDKVAFSVREFVELVNEDHPPGSMIVMEESSVSMNAKTWWSSEQIRLGEILDTWRHQNRGALFTLPAFGDLQKSARGRMHALMQTRGIDYKNEIAALRYRYVEQDSDTGKIYKKYHRLPDPETGVENTYTWIGLPKPSKELREAYEERKEAFTAELNQEILDELTEEAEESEEQQSPKEIADEIVAENQVREFIHQHPQNKMHYVDVDLLQAKRDLSVREARSVKKLIEREVDVSLIVEKAETQATHT